MATYGCEDSENSAYGAGSYSTCETVGAPNTGYFEQVINSGSFTILAPLAAAVILVVIATVIVRRRKKAE